MESIRGERVANEVEPRVGLILEALEAQIDRNDPVFVGFKKVAQAVFSLGTAEIEVPAGYLVSTFHLSEGGAIACSAAAEGANNAYITTLTVSLKEPLDTSVQTVRGITFSPLLNSPLEEATLTSRTITLDELGVIDKSGSSPATYTAATAESATKLASEMLERLLLSGVE